jgi:hypothetical protein
MPDARPPSHAPVVHVDERLRRVLDRAAATVYVSRTVVEQAASSLETARRLLAGRPLAARAVIRALPGHASSRPSRSRTSSRSPRRAKPGVSQHAAGRRRSSDARLPCTRTGCEGTLRLGRQVVPDGETTMRAAERAWICSERAQHVHLPRAGSAHQRTAALVARTRWEDDGGA